MPLYPLNGPLFQRIYPLNGPLYPPYQIGQFYRFNFFIGVELKQKKIEITIFQ